MSSELFHYLSISPLTALHWMLAVAITLFIIDIFLQSDVVSWLSLFLFAAYFSLYLDVSIGFPLQWLLLLFVVILSVLFVVYYTLWYKLVAPLIKRAFLRNAVVEVSDRAAGETAIYRLIEGNEFVNWNGELWSAAFANTLQQAQDGEKVRIIRSESGKMLIETLH